MDTGSGTYEQVRTYTTFRCQSASRSKAFSLLHFADAACGLVVWGLQPFRLMGAPSPTIQTVT